MVWVINKGDVDFEKIDTTLNKRIVIKPFRPIQLPRPAALRYIKFNSITACPDPEKYFENDALRRLVIRDAGIGDLLLLEPVLRQLNKNSCEVTIVTRFPDVYKYNPYIGNVIQMESKGVIPKSVIASEYDVSDDLRSYSETCENRDTRHRTDCYNQVFDVDIKDKEPSLFFSKKEKGVITKKEGRTYIGIACDGSHFFRRYSYGIELIDSLLEDDKNVVVILGDGWEDGQGFVKYGKKNERVIDLQGKTTVRQVINTVKDLDKLVSVDTGLMHIGLSLHVPTVCIFSIIDPKLRIDYYTGPKQVIYTELDCRGCGSWHMAKCPHGSTRDDPKFIPPCLEIPVADVIERVNKLKISSPRICCGRAEKPEINVVEIKKKITLVCIVLNEEKNLPRFIDNVVKHPAIGRVIAVDGGSNDKTVAMLEKAGAFVYTHYYDKDYHDMQALQRNISFSFVRDGEKCVVMDVDECFSDELSEYLPVFAESGIEYGLLSRRTFNYYADIGDPTKQIKDYPDWQPRLYTWNRKFKWWNSPHHILLNMPTPVKIRKDIIHFEKEGKDRDLLERQWSAMEKRSNDVYV